MLAAEDMIKSLLEEEKYEDDKDDNNDHDFSKVLEFNDNDGAIKHKLEILCSDVQKRILSFWKRIIDVSSKQLIRISKGRRINLLLFC